MNELALFAGAGGGILGGHLLGWRTVCAVEWEPYPASVLAARQNDGVLPPFPIWDDVRTFDGRPWRGVVDVVSGGFPCQDISVAGKQEEAREADSRDALRYRWLRANPVQCANAADDQTYGRTKNRPELFDAAIDAAMASKE
jgi:site-specific DNA-cytosine methylase